METHWEQTRGLDSSITRLYSFLFPGVLGFLHFPSSSVAAFFLLFGWDSTKFSDFSRGGSLLEEIGVDRPGDVDPCEVLLPRGPHPGKPNQGLRHSPCAGASSEHVFRGLVFSTAWKMARFRAGARPFEFVVPVFFCGFHNELSMQLCLIGKRHMKTIAPQHGCQTSTPFCDFNLGIASPKATLCFASGSYRK